jgi:hypothetical protein
MSLLLPPRGTELRDQIDVAHLAEIAQPANRVKLPTFREALIGARGTLRAEKAARSVFSYALRADGDLWLLKVNRNGSWKCAWNFGRLA